MKEEEKKEDSINYPKNFQQNQKSVSKFNLLNVSKGSNNQTNLNIA